MLAERAQRAFAPPMAPRHVLLAAGMHRIEDLIVDVVGLPTDEQQDVVVAVVEERVADAGAGGERRKIAGGHRVQLAVDPRINVAAQHEDKFFFVTLRMRP